MDVNSEAKSPWLKTAVKTILRRFGFDLVRYQPTDAKPVNILDLAIRSRLSVNPDFRFLQVGANDGVRHDPIRELVLEFGLRGVLLEPLPDMFEALRENYSGQPQLEFVNAAVSAGEDSLTLATSAPARPCTTICTASPAPTTNESKPSPAIAASSNTWSTWK